MAGDCKLVNKLPAKLLNYLMPFQKSGVQFAVEKNGKCMIADEMGLGKTVQAIAVAYYYREDWPMLVIMPSSLRYPWLEELEKWLPGIHPHDMNLIQGGTDVSGIGTSKVSLVTFGLLSSPSSVLVKEALMNQKFKVVIVDESHYIRNFRTACSQSVVPLVKQADRRILLSGTPALARPVELYPQLEALCPGRFGSWWEFTTRYCDATIQYFGKQRRRKVDGASHLDELQTRLTSEVMIRREKKDVLKQLPPKQRQRVLFELKDSSLKTEILDTFEELEPHLSRAGPDLNKASSIDVKVNNKIRNNGGKKNKSGERTQKMEVSGEITPNERTKSAKVKNTKGSMKGSMPSVESPKHSHEEDNNMTLTSVPGDNRVTMLSLISKLYKLTAEAKIGPVKEYVSLLCENPKLKFLVFAYHHCMMDGIQQTLWENNVKFIRIDGNTKPSERLYFVQQFQGDPDCRVAILSILAAGVGLTFTAAKLVIFAEMYWTPGMMVQCEDRAHRIGQTSCVAVHYLVAKGTMDEWVWSAVCKKTTVVTATLNGRVQTLEAAAGDQYQVDVLSNAEAWVPSDNPSECDITSMFLSQQPANQPSIKDFFASSQLDSTPKFSPKISASRLPSVTKACSSPSEREFSDQDDIFPIVITLSDEEDIDMDKKVSSKKLEAKPSVDGRKILLSGKNSGKRKRISDIFERQQKSKRGKFNPRSSSHSTIRRKSVIKRLDIKDADLADFEDDDLSDFKPGLKGIPNLKTHNTDEIMVGDSMEELSAPDSTYVPTCSTFKSANMENGKQDDHDKINNGTTINGNVHVGELNVTNAWSCTVCTFLNHNSLSYCEMCDTPKKKTRKMRPNNRDKSIKLKRNILEGKAKPIIVQSGHCQIDLLTDSKNKAKNVDYTLESDSTQSDAVTTEFSDSGVDIASNHQTRQRSGIKSVKMTHSLSQDVNLQENCTIDLEQSSEVNCGKSKSGESAEDFLQMLTKLKDDINLNLKDNKTVEVCENVKCNPGKSDREDETSGSEEDLSNFDKTLNKDQYQAIEEEKDSEDLFADYEVSGKDENTKQDQIDHNNYKSDLTENYPEGVEIKEITDDPVKDHWEMYDVTTDPEMEEDTTVDEMDSKIVFIDQDKISRKKKSLADKNETRTEDQRSVNLDDDATAVMTIFGSGKSLFESADDEVSDWLCEECNTINGAWETHCEGCLSSKPSNNNEDKTAEPDEERTGKRVINLDKMPVYSSFHYCCSKYTGRIYLFDQEKQPLNLNFLPLDVSVGNTDGLPDLLLHPDNMRVVRRFIQEWKSLSETKRKFLSRHTNLFENPKVAYERLKAGKPNYCINRHLTKETVSLAATVTADRLEGKVRVISRPQNKVPQAEERPREGSVQVLNKDGIPLCMNCEKPYENDLLKDSTIQRTENAWYLRFCSHQCSHTYWMKTHNDYAREQIFELEHGVCQLCGVEAHTVYRQIKDTPNPEKCASLLKKTVYSKLTANQKSRMVKHPTPGLFWHVDHIIPVWEGGGECDIDNLRTLCTPCHQSVTAEQTRRRSRARKLGDAVGCRDITCFFKPS